MEDIKLYNSANQNNSVEIEFTDENTSVEIDPAELEPNSVEIEDTYIPTESDKCWYILPMMLSNKQLFDKKNIKEISSIDMVDSFLINVTYINRPFGYDKESCYYSDHINGDNYTVVYKAPKDKEYIYRMVAKSGNKALTKDMLLQYFINL